MTKAELIQKLATAMETSNKQAETYFNATIAVLTELLVAGETLTLPGFGTFGVKTRSARQGMNPATKQPINLPETQVAYFKVSSKLKGAIANSKPAASSKTKTADKKDTAIKSQSPAKKASGKGTK